jgi:4-amino-4-deoxy-L-arabinose transferase-like glycosyltransferase
MRLSFRPSALMGFVRGLGLRVQHHWSVVLFPADRASRSSTNGFWLALMGVAIASVVLFIPNLSYPLLEPDEGRYAEVSREMFETGNWTVPTLYFQSYCDKPPLFYWLIAASFRLFGVAASSARLVPALAACVTVTATFVFGARMAGIRTGLLGAFILMLSAGFANLGRVLILDGVLTLTVAASLFSALEAISGSRFRWAWWLFSASCCAAGVLIKGPIAFVLLAPPVVLHCWLTGAPARPRWWNWAVFIGVVGALVGPWFFAIMVCEPHFASHFLWRHHVLRFFSDTFHPQPPWYYVPVIVVAFLPWSALFPSLVRHLFSYLPSVRSIRTRPMGFLLLWAAWCLLFFSLSRGKLPTYVMPAMPALALLIASHLDAVLSFANVMAPGVIDEPAAGGSPSLSLSHAPRAPFRVVGNFLPLIVAGLTCAAAIAIDPLLRLCGSASHRVTTMESILWGSVGLGLLLWGRRLTPRSAWTICFVCAFFMNVHAVHRIVPDWANSHSPLAHAHATKKLLRDRDTAIACYGREWGSIAFYGNRSGILNFSLVPRPVLTEFLRSHERTLMFLKSTADIDWFRNAIPDGWEMTPVETIGTASVAIVGRARNQNSTEH